MEDFKIWLSVVLCLLGASYIAIGFFGAWFVHYCIVCIKTSGSHLEGKRVNRITEDQTNALRELSKEAQELGLYDNSPNPMIKDQRFSKLNEATEEDKNTRNQYGVFKDKPW